MIAQVDLQVNASALLVLLVSGLNEVLLMSEECTLQC